MSNNPTHVELKRRVKELEEEAVKGIRAQEALRKTLAKLERKAKERTSELVRRNEDLKREAEERKQVEEALKKRIWCCNKDRMGWHLLGAGQDLQDSTHCIAIGPHEPTGAQLGPAEVAGNHDRDVTQTASL